MEIQETLKEVSETLNEIDLILKKSSKSSRES